MDIATADVIERASQADPEGKRTVGVLTKPDLIDEGACEPVLEALLNKKKPLKLGYCMVKVCPVHAFSLVFCVLFPTKFTAL